MEVWKFFMILQRAKGYLKSLAVKLNVLIEYSFAARWRKVGASEYSDR